jgi:hypothetical protein
VTATTAVNNGHVVSRRSRVQIGPAVDRPELTANSQLLSHVSTELVIRYTWWSLDDCNARLQA